VGCVIPWDYPLSLSVADALPALLAGNAVVLKPDPQTSHTALFVAELLAAAGLPEGILAVLTGDGPETGAAVVDATDFVAFTGSTVTGRGVAARAAERLVGFSLELGGKNAMIVRADADLDRAIRGALRGSFTNSGQLCISIERLLVHASRFEEFLSRFAALASALRLGASLDYRSEIGSLVSSEQLERVGAHVDDAVARGAMVHAGGHPRPDIGPFFYEPTVLTGVRTGMRCHDEETFGPVVALRSFTDDDEAVALANQGRQGLSASVWTRDRRAAERLAAGLVAGSVNVNEAFSAGWGSIDAPMGGFRESGIGRRHAGEGLLRFTEAQTVAVQRLLPLDVASIALDERGRRLVRGALRMVRRLPGLG
jgi:succinate-semialdehyde dehydrogenase/glutarate-semialdehyde dehydrogenase